MRCKRAWLFFSGSWRCYSVGVGRGQETSRLSCRVCHLTGRPSKSPSPWSRTSVTPALKFVIKGGGPSTQDLCEHGRAFRRLGLLLCGLELPGDECAATVSDFA